jgi:hypothetical protein
MNRLILLLSLLGMSLKLGPIYFLTWDWLILSRLKLRLSRRSKGIFIFGVMSLVIFSVVAILNIEKLDIVEFLKSFANFYLFIIAWILVVNFQLTAKSFNNILKICSILLFTFCTLQVVTYKFLNIDYLFHVLDPISISTMEDVGRFEAVNLLGYIRPTGFYHEPSFAALIANVIFGFRKYHYKKNDYFAISTVFLSLSIVGFFTLILSIILFKKAKHQLIWFLLAMSIILVNIEFFRLEEILKPGTSGHERIGVISGTLIELGERYLAPIPLGNFTDIPNNSIQVALGYYSVLMPIFILTLVRQVHYPLLGVLFGILITNGAIFTLSGGLLVGIISWRASSYQ